MPARDIFYLQNTFAGAATQRNIGPLAINGANRVFMTRCRGEVSYQSFNPTVPYTTENDTVWGLQWVARGAAPLDVLVSLFDDHWFWRHQLTSTTDVTRAWGPTTTSGTVQGSDPLTEEYRGQFIKPGTDIDMYVSFKAAFGALVSSFLVTGTIEISWD